ncbi:right-handed parallel beta-helix repeat-containing protein [Haloarcula sp. GH36]|uniref:right-handed parallel beta-helix repeat-containing protein n=1 Tax=Haloarcula montana TaxID=3111776 RepID=UPI002D77FBBD|nr:right-handed parallel beta-helix repeat-containing protein [Haloarcula sp. GH36]
MKRRELLKAAGAAGLTGLAGVGLYVSSKQESGDGSDQPNGSAEGTPAQATGTPAEKWPEWEEFGTVVDAAAEGADPTGQQPVNFLFEEYADDDTLLAFEPGTYRIDPLTVRDRTGFGVVGIGDEPATFVPTDGDCHGGQPWVSFGGIEDFHLENATFDFRSASGGGPIHLLLGGESVVRNVTCLGSCSNQISVLKVEADDSGAVRFENLVARNTDDNQSLTGLFVGKNHAGDLRLDDCTIERFSDNGLYASAPGGAGGGNGPVRVSGGTYRNNNVSGVRLGTTGSSATDVRIVVDAETPGSGGLNARGIRLRNKSGQVIDNCWIRFGENAPESFGGIVCHAANGGAIVRDTTITVDKASIPAIRTFPAEGATGETLTVENCTMSGSTGGGVLARIEGRDGTVFRDCTIEHRGEQRHGLRFIDSSNCRIVDSRIDVTGDPVSAENGTVTVENSTIVRNGTEYSVEQTTLEDETFEPEPPETAQP